MFCVKHTRKANATALFNFLSKSDYSRRSDKNSSTYKVVQANNENLEDVDGAVLGINSNWELLTPRGFRFYLPGSIGPGWSDVTTTAQVKTHVVDLCNNKKEISLNDHNEKHCLDLKQRLMLCCVAQECPLLLRNGIKELFPGCLDVASPNLTIITISQTINAKLMRWNKELETEKLAKYFVLAASDVCTKLRRMGFWADFINPFSGQPHLNIQKNNTLYKTDKRFRCLGFKVSNRNNCKVILYDNNVRNFLGSLYTTAPASTEFLKQILRSCELMNVDEI